MNKQKPINLTLNFLNEMGVAANNDYAFINREMGIVNSMYEMNNRFFHVGQPYRTKEMRILRGLRGSARMSVNLMEYTIKEHTIGLIPPNALLQIVDISGDYDIQALAADSNFIPTQQHSILTDWHTQQAFFLDNHVEEWRRTGTFFSLIWDAVHLQPYRREVVQHLITSLLYNVHYLQDNYHRDELLRPSRHEELFRRFITLVNEYCKTQHRLLRRPPLPVTPLPEHRHPRRQRTHRRRVGQPGRRPRSQGTAEAQRPAHLSDSRRTTLPEPIVLQQILQADDGHDAAGVSADVKNTALLPNPFNPEATSYRRPASSCLRQTFSIRRS